MTPEQFAFRVARTVGIDPERLVFVPKQGNEIEVVILDGTSDERTAFGEAALRMMREEFGGT
jgi:hypothetical protein